MKGAIQPAEAIRKFDEEVALKYHLFSSLFLTLPFAGMEEDGSRLPLFAAHVEAGLKNGDSPIFIVEGFLNMMKREGHGEQGPDLLFRFLQFIERQVVLFDALEDAAFEKVRELDGVGSLREIAARVEATGRMGQLKEALNNFRVRVVLTAHPTQFYPEAVRGIIAELAEAIRRNDLGAIRDLLLQMGRTPFRNRTAPTPLDEARGVLWYLEEIFYRTLPDIQRRLGQAAGLEGLDLLGLDPKVEVGFWPGGDRDGNPFVTAQVTLATGAMLKGSVLRLYRSDLRALARRLTFDGILDKVQAIHDRLDRTLLEHRNLTPDRLNRAAEVKKGDAATYGTAQEFLADLKDLRVVLHRDHQGLFGDLLDGLITKVGLFGFHFAPLDLRQDSRIHEAALAEIRKGLSEAKWVPDGLKGRLAGWDKSPQKERLETLDMLSRHPMAQEKIPAMAWTHETAELLSTFRCASWIQVENGPLGAHRYIISNTRHALDVATVWFFARIMGMPADRPTLDVVPLFETIEDLRHAGEIMEELYTWPVWMKHLDGRALVQPIMVGFSDGTKDGGYVTANWAIFRAKERLTDVSRAYGVRPVFFDGRGGPPARGGGSTHAFYKSLGPTVEHREIHLTIQGQTISSKFGTPESCRLNMEQLLAALVERRIFSDGQATFEEDDRQVMDELSKQAEAAYRDFRKDPAFLPYLETRTPLLQLSQTNIGSRPAKRGGGSGLTFEALRAIPYVTAWSQVKLNIPGYYGFGSALENMAAQGMSGKIRGLYQRNLFFRTLVENTLMSLSKSRFDLTSQTAKDPKFGPFWHRMKEEALRTERLLLEASETSHQADRDPVTRESIALREKMVLPLLVIQQYALDRISQAVAEGAPEGLYQKLVIKTLAANVNAARNSA